MRSRRLIVSFATGSVLCLITSVACSPPDPRGDVGQTAPAEPAADAGALAVADSVEIVHGVADRGRDPAVVAISVGDTGLCSGTLISPQIVLTARHCVSQTSESVGCPATGAQIYGEVPAGDLGIYVGDDVVSARRVARGAAIVAPRGVVLCDADMALIVLDEPVTGVKPLPVGTRGPAAGDHIRAVGFGKQGSRDPAGRKLLREHVRVLSVTNAEFTVGEATCQGDSGGPAIDEDTGEVVGVVSRGGPSCDGPGVHNVYTRVDTFASLVDEAFARVGDLDGDADAGAGGGTGTKPPKRGTKQKPPSDVGGACTTGDDCAAGVCITDGAPGADSRRYCSRPCGGGDRCPTHYHCKDVAAPGGAAQSACVEAT